MADSRADIKRVKLLDFLTEVWAPGSRIERTPLGATLPSIPTVYLLVRHGDVVYAGQTVNLRRRLLQHDRNPRMQKLLYDSVWYFMPEIPCKHARLQIETVLNAGLNPIGHKATMLVQNRFRQLTEIKWNERRADKGKAIRYGLTIKGKTV